MARKADAADGTAIRITCEGSDMVDISTLTPFQGDLKTLTKDQAAKIRESIVKHGFSFPVFVWEHDGSSKIIDGHQRVFVVNNMLEDGYTLAGSKIPVVRIEAADEREAKQKVLLAASRYARIDELGLTDFLNDAGITIEEMMSTIDLPDLKLDFGDTEKEIYDKPDIDDQFIVVIECKNETQQQKLFEQLTKEGHACRLVM